MRRILIGLFVSLMISLSAFASSDPLPVNKAFVFTSYVDAENNAVFFWTIAPGYYLYQDKIRITLSPTSEAKLSPLMMPKSKEVRDLMGDMHAVYMGRLKVIAPVIGTFHGPLTFTISYQGCSLNGFCYTPVKKYLNLTDTAVGKKLQAVDTVSSSPYTTLFAEHNLFFIVLSFLGLGLLLAFTPCVLPVIPILSSIIIGHKKSQSHWHTFGLSFAYVWGMSVTYALAGMFVAKLGENASLFFQKPSVIIVMSGLFIFLALSLFGFFDLRLPGKMQRTITELSMKQKSGSYAGVFVMGCLSTLIVSPCVSPPLVGVLAYIAQTGNTTLGGVALLALGFGMGIPLLLIGASAKKWLPQSGHWMDWIRKFLSLMMVAVALWMLSRVYSPSLMLFIGSIIFILFSLYSVFLYERNNVDRKLFQTFGAIIGLYGALMLVNVSAGNLDLLRPWQGIQQLFAKNIPQATISFTTYSNMPALDRTLYGAQKKDVPVMIDFYADWCSACVAMDKMVFSRADVVKALRHYILLRIDVTNNTAFDQAVMQRFNVVAPPVVIFFDKDGKELTMRRMNGEVDAETFLKNLEES